MANEDIGLIECAVCGFKDAHVRASKNGRAYVYCDDCEHQAFARGPVSDQRIRERMRPTSAAAPVKPESAKPKRVGYVEPGEPPPAKKRPSDDWGF